MDGGTFGLLGLISTHRGAVEYDLRHRFGIGLHEIGHSMTILEAARLVKILRADPSSMIAAALEGWAYPFPRDEAILADLYDLEHAKSGAKNRKPYPRPFKTSTKVETYGNTGGRSQAEVRAILNAHGHNLPIPA